MQTPSPEQKLEIARRVHETFDRPRRWHQGGWGRDDDGDVIEFDGGFHVVDNDEVRHRPAFRLATPESPRCFCLGAAIRIHTGSVLCHDPSHTGDATETICAVYTRLAGIDTGARERDAADFEPHAEQPHRMERLRRAFLPGHPRAHRRRAAPPRRAALVIPDLRRPRSSPLCPPCRAHVRRPEVRPAGAGRAGDAAREVPPRAGQPMPLQPGDRHAPQDHRPRRQVRPVGHLRDRRRPHASRPPPSSAACSTGTPVNGVFMDELAAALGEFGWAPDYAIRHPKYCERRYARLEVAMAAHLRRGSLRRPRSHARDLPGRRARPERGRSRPATISWRMRRHVADSGAWFSRKPARWFRANPDHDRVARRRVREAVRFVPIAPNRTGVLSHAQDYRDHRLTASTSSPTPRRRTPASGIATRVSTTNGTTSSTRTSRPSAGSSA